MNEPDRAYWDKSANEFELVQPYHPNDMPTARQVFPVYLQGTLRGDNRSYAGTYFESSGDYARVKLVKGS